MKTTKSLLASANGARDNAIRKCDQLRYDLHLSQNASKDKRNKLMPRIRAELADLTKYIHETNAYFNALDTE